MANSATLVIKIVTDAAKASKGLGQASSKVQKFSAGINKAVPAAAATATAIAGLGIAAVNAASKTEQAMGGVDAVFKQNAAQVKKWAAGAAQSVGLTSAEYAEFATSIGGNLKNAGIPMDQIAGKTDQLIKQAADLAATYGGTTADAVNALGSALRGEADPAERLNLNLKASQVNAQMAAAGTDKLTGAAANAAKAQATLDLITKQSADSQGKFASEADTAAGAAQRNSAAWGEALSTLGTALLPVVTAVTNAFAGFANWVQQNSTLATVLIGVLGGIAAAVLVVASALAVINVVMAANPVVLIIMAIIAAIGLLVAAFLWLWNNVEGFRSFIMGMFYGIQDIAGNVASFFKTVWGAAVDFVTAVVKNIGSFFNTVFNGIKTVVTNVANFFKTVWRVVILAVQIYIKTWKTIFTTIFNAVRSAVNGVANFFKNAWNNAVNGVKTVIRGLQSVFTSVFNAIKRPINAVKAVIDGVINVVRNLIGWISRIRIPDLSALNPFKSVAPQAAAPAAGPAGAALYAAPRVVGGSTTVSRGGGGGIVINIHGGLDSKEAIARAVKKVLTDSDRRNGGVVLNRRAA